MRVHQADFACAQQRVGRTSLDRARWLLDFCQGDSRSVVSDQDKEKFLVFLEADKNPALGVKRDSQPNLTIEDLIWSWRLKVNKKLSKLVGGDHVELDGKFTRRVSLRNGILTVEVEVQPNKANLKPSEFLAWETLASVGTRLRVCANQKCDHLFVREGKVVYCSVRCRAATTKRNYRARKNAKPG